MILAAGMTPAWQHILRYEMLGIGGVNRAEESHWCASGKVINVGKALHNLGGDALTLAMLGGRGGEAIRAEFEEHQIPARWVTSTASTRACTTVLEYAARRTTELVENAAGVDQRELEAFQQAYGDEVSTAECVVLSGSLPPGTPNDYYLQLLQKTKCRVVIDARGPELLSALSAKPFLVKPNREELERTVDRYFRREEETWQAIRELTSRGAEWVVITDGHRPVLVSHGEQRWRLHPPVRDVVNPIGSGDCLAAAIVWGLQQDIAPIDAIRFGIAAAAENVTTMLPAEFDPEKAKQAAQTIQVDVL